jgi:hypothetical protein
MHKSSRIARRPYRRSAPTSHPSTSATPSQTTSGETREPPRRVSERLSFKRAGPPRLAPRRYCEDLRLILRRPLGGVFADSQHRRSAVGFREVNVAVAPMATRISTHRVAWLRGHLRTSRFTSRTGGAHCQQTVVADRSPAIATASRCQVLLPVTLTVVSSDCGVLVFHVLAERVHGSEDVIAAGGYFTFG